MINNISYVGVILPGIELFERVSQAVTTLRTRLIERASQAIITGTELFGRGMGLDRVELIGRIYQHEATPYIASGLLGIILGPASLSTCNAFLIGTAAVPVIQGAKAAIFEGKTLEEAVKEVCKKSSTSILAGIFAARIGLQIGLDARTSFIAGAGVIPTVIAFKKLQVIKGLIFKKFNYTIQKVKVIFARIYQFLTRIYQFLIGQLTQINKIIQRTFNKDPKINKIVQINTIIQQTSLRYDITHKTELFG